MYALSACKKLTILRTQVFHGQYFGALTVICASDIYVQVLIASHFKPNFVQVVD